MLEDLQQDSVPYITTYTKTSDPVSPESESSEDSSDDTNSDSESSQEQTSESSESFDQSITVHNEEEEIPFINMNTKAEVVEPDDEAEGETSPLRPQRTDFPQAKGVQLFTIDDIPSEKWEARF